jgi:phosphomannomutase
MKALMRKWRAAPPSQIGGQKVLLLEDYLTGTLPFPASDVLRFWLEDQTKLVIRPSGTEPKIKIYAEVFRETTDRLEETIQECDERLKQLTHLIS